MCICSSRLIYLTLQTNLLGMVYYNLSIVAVVFGLTGLQVLERWFGVYVSRPGNHILHKRTCYNLADLRPKFGIRQHPRVAADPVGGLALVSGPSFDSSCAGRPGRRAGSASRVREVVLEELRGFQGMGVISDRWFDCVLPSFIYMLKPSCRPMFKPPSLGPP